MITIEELAEIVVRHTPENAEGAGMTAAELAQEMRDALSDPEDEESVKALHGIVNDIWQHGYNQGRAAGTSTTG